MHAQLLHVHANIVSVLYTKIENLVCQYTNDQKLKINGVVYEPSIQRHPHRCAVCRCTHTSTSICLSEGLYNSSYTNLHMHPDIHAHAISQNEYIYETMLMRCDLNFTCIRSQPSEGGARSPQPGEPRFVY